MNKPKTAVGFALFVGLASAILTGGAANAATAVTCNVTANLVGDKITPVGTLSFPADADHAVISYDLAAAGGQNATINPVFDGPLTGDPFTFQVFDLIGGLNLPALPATVTVHWKFYTKYGKETQEGFTGSCPVVNVTDANPTTPTPSPTPTTAPPTTGGGDVTPVKTPYGIGDAPQPFPWPFIGVASVMLFALGFGFRKPIIGFVRGDKSE